MFDVDHPRRAGVEDSHIAYLNGLLERAMRAKRFEDARDLAETLIQLEPLNPKSWAALSSALRAQGKTAQAEAAEELGRCL